MNPATLRAWWSYRQGLDGRLKGASACEVLSSTGWARSVGGVGPYLTLFARAEIRRAEAEAAVANLEIHELPTARGCTYLTPSDDFALGLAAGASFREADTNTAAKLGVTQSEIDALCEAVVLALERGVMSPDEIRDATGDASRSLGEEGKKKGLTTTLPIALGRLQATGHIRRVPIDGRLDQQRYKYTLWHPSPLSGFSLSADEIQMELARRYYRWIGPATLGEFQWFSALGVAAAKKAVAPLNLVPISAGSDRYILPEQKDEFEAFVAPRHQDYRLISSLDGVSLLRRDLKSMLDEADASQKVFADKNFAKLDSLADLPNHAIVDRGRLVGLWEYDTFSKSIAWVSFIPKSQELVAAVAEMETYVRDELGDARSFSLDSPKSRIQAVEALKNGNREAS